MLPWEIVLIDKRLNGFVGVFCDRALKPANKLILRNCSAEAGQAANQIAEFAKTDGDVGAVLVLKRFELPKRGINISVCEAAIAVQ